MFTRTGPWRRPGPGDPAAPGMREMARLGLPLFLATTFAVIYTKIDIVMLERMIGEAAAGIYGQGHQAFDTMLLVPGLLGTALFPAMARYGMKGVEDTVRMATARSSESDGGSRWHAKKTHASESAIVHPAVQYSVCTRMSKSRGRAGTLY